MNEPIRYSAGLVTAYGAAVRGGYQGSYEQWCQDMANLGANVAEVREKAAQVEQTAQDFTEQTVPAAIQSVEDAGADQVQTVEAAGTDVEADIDAAKTTSISALQTESATQQAAIQQKGEDTIESIPADYTALTEEVNDLKSATGELGVLEPISALPLSAYGEDEIKTMTNRAVKKTGNRFEITSAGSSTSYRYIRLFGGLIANASLGALGITYDNSLVIPTLTGCDVYAVSKYKHIDGGGNATAIYFAEVTSGGEISYLTGPEITWTESEIESEKTKPGIFAVKLDPTKRFNAILYSKNAARHDEIEISLIAVPQDADINAAITALNAIGSEFRENDPDLDSKVNGYASRLFSKTNIESFMFFTDSHLVGASHWKETHLLPLYREMGAVYKTAPVDFCIFGGDAITNNSTTAQGISRAQAVSYLSCNDKLCRTIFGEKYFPMVGNHDFNYESLDGSITTQDLVNAEFRKWGRAYYKFNGNTSTVYVLDTGMNHVNNYKYQVPINEYKLAQIEWLAQSLIEDDPTHAIICMHIIKNNDNNLTEFPMFQVARALCAAYNAHVSFNETIAVYDYDLKEKVRDASLSYNFSGCEGRVELFLGGHLHNDTEIQVSENSPIPCVMRANLRNGSVAPTYDLVLCDWDGGTVTFYRIGNGDLETIINLVRPEGS